MTSVWDELKRRNVIKVAIAYVIVAWLTLQIGDTLGPALRLPEAVNTALAFFLILGFPLAVFFAWAYELTPEGLKKEKHVDRSQSITHITGRKLDFIIIGVMAIAIAYFLADKFVWVGEEPTTTVAVSEERPSIAVLPFANRSANEDDAFFVDGIHDDLLSHISKIGSLKVISRTSMLQYRDTTKTIPQIAEELGVATVLEGGVQRAGEQVRINVQLIDARTDEHLWSEIYDRQLSATNIFTVQSEIATAIADALQAVLSPEERDRLTTVPTQNLAALEAYFHGKQRMAKRGTEALAEAVDYFQQAVELDPDFALAWVGLADSNLLQAAALGLWTDVVFSKVEPMIDKALELDDQLGEAYTTLGWVQAASDPAAAEVTFKRALELNPNYATAHHRYGRLLRSRGRLKEGLARYRKAVELDPRSAILNYIVGYALADLGRFDVALAQYRKVIEIDPAYAGAYIGIADHHWTVSGQLDEAVALHRKAIAVDPGDVYNPAYLGLLYLDLGDDRKAEFWAKRSLQLGPNSMVSNETMRALYEYRGEEAEALDFARKVLSVAYRVRSTLAYLRNYDLQAGRYAGARARYEKSYPALLNEDAPKIDRTNFIPAIDLALVLAETGEQERADLLLDRSLTFIPTIHRLGYNGYGIADVRIYALQGKTEKALAALRQAIDQGWRFSWWYYLEHDPNLDSIRNEPEFQGMVEEIKADMATQLERLRAMEASGELEPIPDID